MSRPYVLACRGRSPLTGKPVGERHRWGGGAWGKGRCDFCGHYLEDVLERPAAPAYDASKRHQDTNP